MRLSLTLIVHVYIFSIESTFRHFYFNGIELLFSKCRLRMEYTELLTLPSMRDHLIKYLMSKYIFVPFKKGN